MSNWRLLARQSLSLDRALLGSGIPAVLKRRFLSQKARVLPILLLGHPTTLDLGVLQFHMNDISALGTFQSCIVDIQNELITSGILVPTADPLVVDVGANVGQFATAVKLLCPASRVISFEPDPTVFSLLQENIGHLPNVRAYCFALGSSTTRLPLYRHELSVMSSLVFEGGGREPKGVIDVDVVRLDDVIATGEIIDILKVDVEGFELDVLKGSIEVLRRTRYLLLELGLGREDDGRNLEVLSFVKSAVPDARIIRFGRPLGGAVEPICQDVLISLHM